MSVCGPDQLGAALCELLGLDADLVISLTIRCTVGAHEFPTVDVTQFVSSELGAVTKRFKVVEA